MNWWETFFEGVAVEMWLKAVPEAHTAREADALVRDLRVPAGAELLDVPCGAGRLALPLAGRGFRLTGVDLSAESLAHARAADPARAVTWEQRDMRALSWPGRFDGAFCLGNSFGYMSDDENLEFLRAVARSLKQGARFVLETPMIIENLLGHIHARAWWPAGDIRLLVANAYDARRSRLEIDYTFVVDGRSETRHGSHRVYSFRELFELLERAGFRVETSEPWTKDAHSIRFIATVSAP
jgi:SAM-dependent methyltransferase